MVEAANRAAPIAVEWRVPTRWETTMKNSAAARDRSKLVTAVFDSGDAVEGAYEVVSRRGYGITDIDVVMSDETRRRYFAQDHPVNMALGLKLTEGGEMGGPMGGA